MKASCEGSPASPCDSSLIIQKGHSCKNLSPSKKSSRSQSTSIEEIVHGLAKSKLFYEEGRSWNTQEM